jgi:signal transduction histidine kinase
MNKHEQPSESQVEIALKESEYHPNQQNIEFDSLKHEYSALNEELIESLKCIQKMNEALAFAKNKADESDRLKSAFLANILHEIGTPMNAIIGFSDLLMDTKVSEVRTEQFIQIINTSCRQLLSVIGDIIDISKIDAGQVSIDKELVNIHLLLKGIHTTFKKQVYKKEIKLIYRAKTKFSKLETETNPYKVKQVLCNLLRNAIKFTQQGKVEFGFDVKGKLIEFYVKDTGIGIVPKNHAMIFDRFRQVECTIDRLYGGNGLGLSIAKALVEKLGGAIMVNSELEKGSTFTFTIPLLRINRNRNMRI